MKHIKKFTNFINEDLDPNWKSSDEFHTSMTNDTEDIIDGFEDDDYNFEDDDYNHKENDFVYDYEKRKKQHQDFDDNYSSPDLDYVDLYGDDDFDDYNDDLGFGYEEFQDDPAINSRKDKPNKNF